MKSNLKDLQFSDIFVMEEIQRLQDLFSDATGVASLITSPDGVPLTKPSNFCRLCNDLIRSSEKGRLNCLRSDAILGRYNPTGPNIRTCFSGDLWDAGVSITVGGKHIASWLVGQVRSESSNIQHMLQYAKEIGVNPDLYREALEEIPEMSFEKFTSIAEMLFRMVNEVSEKTYSGVLLNCQMEEREQMNALLKESEEKYRMLVENCKDIIFTFDKEGCFLYVSPACQSVLGLRPEEVVGKTLQGFLHPDDLNRCLLYLKTIEDEKISIQDFEFRIYSKDGALHHLSSSLVPILAEEGDIKWFYGAAVDVTQQKQADREIQKKNEELEKANAIKDRFFSIIAHDLRSPFGSLLGLSKMMAEDLSDFTMEQIQLISQSIYETSENLYRLLENLLEWTRLQQNLITINWDRIVLQQVVNESLRLFKESIRNKELELIVDIPEDVEVYADVNVLQTIFRNLISNTVKFTPKGGKIHLLAKQNQEDFVDMFVIDTGIGMTPEMQDNIFRPDVSTGRKGTENEPSTGLGLLLCKDFINRLGGTIDVKSTCGVGTEFHFTIPAYQKTKEEINQIF